MPRILRAVSLCSVIAIGACGGTAASTATFDPNDPAITAAIDSLRANGADRTAALAAYDGARRRAFRGKWIVERVIAAVVANPWLINRAARTLSRRRDMADLLIGVTGDFVPAREIVNARYVLTTFGVLG